MKTLPPPNVLLEMAGQIAHLFLVQQGDPHLYTHVMLIAENESCALQVHWDGEEEFQLMIEALRQMAHEHNCVGYSLVTEVMGQQIDAKDVEDGNWEDAQGVGEPIEFVYAIAKYAKQPAKIRMWRITRDKDDKVTALYEEEDADPAIVFEPLVEARILPGDHLH